MPLNDRLIALLRQLRLTHITGCYEEMAQQVRAEEASLCEWPLRVWQSSSPFCLTLAPLPESGALARSALQILDIAASATAS